MVGDADWTLQFWTSLRPSTLPADTDHLLLIGSSAGSPPYAAGRTGAQAQAPGARLGHRQQPGRCQQEVSALAWPPNAPPHCWLAATLAAHRRNAATAVPLLLSRRPAATSNGGASPGWAVGLVSEVQQAMSEGGGSEPSPPPSPPGNEDERQGLLKASRCRWMPLRLP